MVIIITAPEPDDPQDAVVARQFKDHPDYYRQTAKFWTYYFATDRPLEKRKQFESYEGNWISDFELTLLIDWLIWFV